MTLTEKVLKFDNKENRSLPREQRIAYAQQIYLDLEASLKNGVLPELSSFIYGIRIAAELQGHTQYALKKSADLTKDYNTKAGPKNIHIEEIIFFDNFRRIMKYNVKSDIFYPLIIHSNHNNGL